MSPLRVCPLLSISWNSRVARIQTQAPRLGEWCVCFFAKVMRLTVSAWNSERGAHFISQGKVLSVGSALQLTQYDIEDVIAHCHNKCAARAPRASSEAPANVVFAC